MEEFATLTRSTFASSPGDQAIGNEDAVVVGPDVFVVTDGVTPLDRATPPCRHGVAWYAKELAKSLAEKAVTGDSLVRCLAVAITDIRKIHESDCDLGDVDAPAATVAVVRVRNEQLEYLVLADTTIVVDLGDHVRAISDDRPATVGRRVRATGNRPSAREFRSAWANRPNGYWVAAADPAAANEALTGSFPLRAVRRAVLATDGATRLVDTFRLYDWKIALHVIEELGASAWIDRTRAAERGELVGEVEPSPRSKRHDDASLVFLDTTRTFSVRQRE